MGLTNGVYLRCDSFDTAAAPMATMTLLHKSLPDKVWGSMILQQQTHWVHKYDDVQVAHRLQPDEPWPVDVRLSDRWTGPDGVRSVIYRQPVYVWIHKTGGDLPVFKASRNRSSGMKALINCSSTFDHRKGPLKPDIPCNDATRQVSDAVVRKWHTMCSDLQGRTGRDVVGSKHINDTGKKISALQPGPGALHTMPGMVQADSPEMFHHVVLNNCVVVINFVRELIEKHDPDSVLSFVSFYFCCA